MSQFIRNVPVVLFILQMSLTCFYFLQLAENYFTKGLGFGTPHGLFYEEFCCIKILKMFKTPVCKMSLVMRKPDFCICKNKDAEQLAVTAKLISAFVFAIQIVQSLYFLNQKFQVSSDLLLLLYSPVCVGPGLKPRRPVFSQRGSFARGILHRMVLVVNFFYFLNYNFLLCC